MIDIRVKKSISFLFVLIAIALTACQEEAPKANTEKEEATAGSGENNRVSELLVGNWTTEDVSIAFNSEELPTDVREMIEAHPEVIETMKAQAKENGDMQFKADGSYSSFTSKKGQYKIEDKGKTLFITDPDASTEIPVMKILSIDSERMELSMDQAGTTITLKMKKK